MKAKKIWIDKDSIFVETTDNRTANMPLEWFKKLRTATKIQLEQYELWEDNSWIHWDMLGEDLSVEGFFTFNKNTFQIK